MTPSLQLPPGGTREPSERAASPSRASSTGQQQFCPKEFFLSKCNFCYYVSRRRNIDLKSRVGSPSLSLTSIKVLRDQPIECVECPGFQEMEKPSGGSQHADIGTVFQNVLNHSVFRT